MSVEENIARVCHEANRAFCEATGDLSQPTWVDAPEWQTRSAIKGVAGVLAGNGPEESHKSWLVEKAATGWKYGEIKDPEAKTHPCFLPYDELPPEQKLKDHLFVGIVDALRIRTPEDIERESGFASSPKEDKIIEAGGAFMPTPPPPVDAPIPGSPQEVIKQLVQDKIVLTAENRGMAEELDQYFSHFGALPVGED